jgi:hypothetical protein
MIFSRAAMLDFAPLLVGFLPTPADHAAESALPHRENE